MTALFQSLSIGGSSWEGSGGPPFLGKLVKIMQIDWLIMRDNAICTCIHLQRDLQKGRTC
jgi:hypothetical protein